MFTAECLVAALLLTAPQVEEAPPANFIESTILEYFPRHNPAFEWAMVLRPNILALAIADEILDPREKGFVMGQDVMGDLAMLQGRYQEYFGAPMVHEAERFPDRQTMYDYLATNRKMMTHLTERKKIDLHHEDEIYALIDQNNQLYAIWDAARDSRCEYYYVTVRRMSLDVLRRMIGDEAFYSGRMPPYCVFPY